MQDTDVFGAFSRIVRASALIYAPLVAVSSFVEMIRIDRVLRQLCRFANCILLKILSIR